MKFLLIGYGNMGRALACGWQSSLPEAAFWAVDPHGEATEGVFLSQKLADLPESLVPQVTLLAVKPQHMDAALDDLASHPRLMQGLVLSIAAGKKLEYFLEKLGASLKLVRVMPNTPALIGCGMSALVASPGASPADRALAEQLMQAVGQTVWLEDETLMDGFTALAGSGPAYVFYLLECMAAAGVFQGLPADVARAAALQTVLGAAQLAHKTGEDFTLLRERVTSKGGTTEAALQPLMGKDGLAQLMHQAITAATERGKML